MKFKYSCNIDGLEDCPPRNSKAENTTLYRIVTENIADRDNGIPVLIINPRRANDPKFRTSKQKCSGYGISLFNSREKMENFAVQLKNDGFLRKSLTHIAECSIEEHHGLITPARKDGHCDLHEYEETNLTDLMRIICKIP